MPRPRERKILLPGQSKFLSLEEEKIAIDNKSRELKELNKRLQKMLDDLEKTEEGI